MSIDQLEDIIVIIPAAGVGSRMQSIVPKQYLELMGKPILLHTIDALRLHAKLQKFIIVISKDDPFIHEIPFCQQIEVDIIEGGKERADSVYAGVLHARKKYRTKWVLVHDAARPLIDQNDINKLFRSIVSSEFRRINADGAILATPIKDTVKQIIIDKNTTYTESTVPREKLFTAQTPQLFPTNKLLEALEFCQKKGVQVTDESSAIEHFGGRTLLVQGSANNIKLTEPADLDYIEFIISKRVLLANNS